jgi:hypothetical protein
MEPEKRTERLRALMAQHNLKAKDVGAILKRSPQTVRAWACTAYDQRAIPEDALFRLESVLQAKGAE